VNDDAVDRGRGEPGLRTRGLERFGATSRGEAKQLAAVIDTAASPTGM